MASVDPQLWALIQRFAAQHPRFDPRAAAAVALVESGGRFGAVGDSGSSYGPWQLHVGGALPAGRGAAWANSPGGVQYALQRMLGVSRGLRGDAAVRAIVSRFERPADIPGEISKALGYYGATPRGGGGFTGPTGPSNRGNAAAALALLGSNPYRFQAAAIPSAGDTLAGLLPAPAVAPPPALAPLPGPDYSGTLDAIHKRLLSAA